MSFERPICFALGLLRCPTFHDTYVGRSNQKSEIGMDSGHLSPLIHNLLYHYHESPFMSLKVSGSAHLGHGDCKSLLRVMSRLIWAG